MSLKEDVNYRTVGRILNSVIETRSHITAIWQLDNNPLDRDDKFRLTAELRQSCVDFIHASGFTQAVYILY